MNGHSVHTNGNGNGHGHHYPEKIYFDYNGTTPLAPAVVDVIKESLVDHWSNPSSQHENSKNIKKLIERSRGNLAAMINAHSSNEMIFMSGGTEANNMVFYTALNHYNNHLRSPAKTQQQQLPHFIISAIEHDSVKLIADYFKNQEIAEITEVPVNQYGCINAQEVIDSIQANTILISVMLANNETGVIQPVKTITEKLKNLTLEADRRIYVHTDAAQAIGKIPIDVKDLGVDYLTIVGHKFYGPRIGVLYTKTDSPLCPIFFGGGQEKSLRPGTENTPMILGLGKAAELVKANVEKYERQMRLVRDYLEERLEAVFGSSNLRFNGRSSKSHRLPNTCNVSFIANENFRGHLILSKTRLLEASTGASCHSNNKRASKILLQMGLTGELAANAIRLSIGRETTKQEVDLVVEDLQQALESLK